MPFNGFDGLRERRRKCRSFCIFENMQTEYLRWWEIHSLGKARCTPAICDRVGRRIYVVEGSCMLHLLETYGVWAFLIYAILST